MPPPGFGPKDKDKARIDLTDAGRAAAAAAASKPDHEKYSIRLDNEEDDALRKSLHAALGDSLTLFGAGGRRRLLRDTRKLHQLYAQLTRLGFAAKSVEACLAELHSEATLPDALDWCCLFLPERELPAAFRLAGSGGGRNRRCP